jgi:hypothetical protein
MQHLKMVLVSALGTETVLYTTDPVTEAGWGGLPDVYHAIDFGPNQSAYVNFLRQYLLNWSSGQYAPFNSEYYTGGPTRWGFPRSVKCGSRHGFLKESQHTSVQLNGPELLQSSSLLLCLTQVLTESRCPNILMHADQCYSLTCMPCMMHLILTISKLTTST